MNIKYFLDRLFSPIKQRLVLQLWDGDSRHYGTDGNEIIVAIKSEATARDLFPNLPQRFAEAYMAGLIDINGPLTELVKILINGDFHCPSLSLREKAFIALMTLRQKNSISRAASNIVHHYDLGNEFFSLWLGKEMVYSCAYFKSHTDGIDAAQEQKFDHICEKLQLRHDETILDIGCGWGGLLIHACKKYGVKGFGITLSPSQKALTEERIISAGLRGRLRVELMDYRKLPPGLVFDKLVSVGMLEHVGLAYYRDFFSQISQCLKPNGLALIQSIGRHIGAEAPPWICKYIFPGMYLPSIGNIGDAAATHGLYVSDVEVLRLHYALTLERWLALFEENAHKIDNMYGQAFTRMWRMYLSCCIANFRYGNLTLWQVTMTQGLNNHLPLTRAFLYGGNARPC